MNRQKLYSLVRQGLDDYNMIQAGDRVAVGVSGGKDSMALLTLLHGLRKFYPKDFSLMAITCDVGFAGMDFSSVEDFCQGLEIPYEIVHTQIAEIVFEGHKDERPCSLCAKMRKGALYTRLNELGVNKIAYAHNKDDFIETALMSMIFEGRFYSFPPVTELEKSGVTVIRPMMYVPEQAVVNFVKQEELPVVKNKCPVDGSTNRAYAKNLLDQIGREHRGSRDRIMHAIESAGFEDWPKKVKK